MLSISGCGLIRFRNEFVVPDPETPIINFLDGWSRICDRMAILCSFMSSFVT